MNSGKYQLKRFLTDHYLDQIVIPEIQRDYVWKEDNVLRLLESIKVNADRQADNDQNISEDILNKLQPQAREQLIKALNATKNFCNVGFIYAYFDPQAPGRFILIDGQQRMTTLFLLLLSVSIKENKQDYFARTYFNNQIPRFDYKVREETHSFLINLIDYLLKNGSINDIKDEHWFFQEYENDVSINSILKNYECIFRFITQNEISLEYIENYIEFWYFDTNKSKQGEELYIYMNSRGESISPNESIKAHLLKELPDLEKHNWGEKWETWQDLFWKHKKSQPTADFGFEEFLKWLKIIHYLLNNNSDPVVAQIRKIRSIKDEKKINTDGLSLKNIEIGFNALVTILNHKSETFYKSSWLSEPTDAIDYLRLFPVLMYVSKYENCPTADLRRFSRFFYNIIRFDSLSKTPFASLINIVNLTAQFLKAGYTDICDLRQLSSNKAFDNILTTEELTKFALYKEQRDEVKRSDLEQVFWATEDYKLCDGRISFLWHYMDFDYTKPHQHFDIEKFESCFFNFKTLFDQSDDLLRRALLTKGDYAVYDGRTVTLEAERYSFIVDELGWKSQFNNKNRVDIYRALVQDYINLKLENEKLSRSAILAKIIAKYLETVEQIDWKYYVIKDPSVLEYCRRKFMSFSDQEVYLLQDKNAGDYNWTTLPRHLGLAKIG